jgi:hypothetical protein
MSIESLMRVAGRDEALSSLVARAQLWPLPITLASPASSEDYALLDLSLRTEPGAPAVDDNAPVVGLGYAGFTPRQRGQFLAWQQTPLTPAPPAFQPRGASSSRRTAGVGGAHAIRNARTK